MINKITKFIFNLSWQEKKLLIYELFFVDGNLNYVRLFRAIRKMNQDNNINELIIDIGAFDGMSSVLMAKQFPSHQILCFEANPTACKMAENNLKKYPNVTLYPFAISSDNVNKSFFVSDNLVSSSLNSIESNGESKEWGFEMVNQIEVQARKLDSFCHDKKVLLIKIDTQGHELEVLKGAVEVLANTKYIMVEMQNHDIYTNSCKYYDVDEFLRNNNFQLLDIVVTYRENGIQVKEYDAIYINTNNIQ